MEIKEDITVPEIKEELETLGVTFDEKLKKPELYELLVKAREDASKPEATQEVSPQNPQCENTPIDGTSYFDVVVKCPKLQVRSEPHVADDTKRYVVLKGGILRAIPSTDSEWTTLSEGCYVKSEFVEAI